MKYQFWTIIYENLTELDFLKKALEENLSLKIEVAYPDSKHTNTIIDWEIDQETLQYAIANYKKDRFSLIAPYNDIETAFAHSKYIPERFINCYHTIDQYDDYDVFTRRREIEAAVHCDISKIKVANASEKTKVSIDSLVTKQSEIKYQLKTQYGSTDIHKDLYTVIKYFIDHNITSEANAKSSGVFFNESKSEIVFENQYGQKRNDFKFEKTISSVKFHNIQFIKDNILIKTDDGRWYANIEALTS